MIGFSRSLGQNAWPLALGLFWLAAVAVTFVLQREHGRLGNAQARPLHPTCAFRWATGLPCPACGTTRATLALADARPLDALRSNPLFTLCVLVGIPVFAAHLVRGRALDWSESRWAVAGVLVGVVVVLNWMYVLWTQA